MICSPSIASEIIWITLPWWVTIHPGRPLTIRISNWAPLGSLAATPRMKAAMRGTDSIGERAARTLPPPSAINLAVAREQCDRPVDLSIGQATGKLGREPMGLVVPVTVAIDCRTLPRLCLCDPRAGR